MVCTLTRVSRVVHLNNCPSKAHSLIKGYASSSNWGLAVPSPQMTTTPLATPSYSPFLSPSPVPTLSHGCRCLPNADRDPLTHILPLAPSLSPEPYGLPITPIHRVDLQPQVFTNRDGLGLGFPATAESLSLPTATPSPTQNRPYGQGQPISLRAPNLARVLTVYVIVWPQYPQPDPFGFGAPSLDSITVNPSILSGIVIYLWDFVGCHSTWNPPSRTPRIFVWSKTD